MEQLIAQWVHNPPEYWGVALLGVNVVAFILMAYDKYQARRGGWRVPEATLFGVSLLGATPAMLVAMQWLRHKRKKQKFYVRIWIILALQILLIFYFL